ncbi:hypothetical protein T265_03092 [Opisthorchis viverrini]|uniref:Uncharacterized protein n=1 Tax=Opisthorchis viverrini TaxID=6198 RepID=A0A074ZTN4_OPIVI|nr:hypothetical protein T265_03092 [Opisthorchis viverrini]KER30481.1 hypothetical protein T265_03092 [Opisthorchis viverrini]
MIVRPGNTHTHIHALDRFKINQQTVSSNTQYQAIKKCYQSSQLVDDMAYYRPLVSGLIPELAALSIWYSVDDMPYYRPLFDPV